MKPIYFYLFLVLISANIFCKQAPAPSEPVLDQIAINKVFTNDLKSKLGINYPLRKGYYNKDKSGEFYILITESYDGYVDEDSLHKNLKILKIAKNDNDFVKTGEINDHITGEEETSIWVWSRYCAFIDVDQDGFIDPILIYGSSGGNGISDGRLKIITWYKDRKIVIRHQNSTLDDDRHTQVDKAFYNLPLSLQKKVRSMMEGLEEKTEVIFPSDWKKAMDRKKLTF